MKVHIFNQMGSVRLERIIQICPQFSSIRETKYPSVETALFCPQLSPPPKENIVKDFYEPGRQQWKLEHK